MPWKIKKSRFKIKRRSKNN